MLEVTESKSLYEQVMAKGRMLAESQQWSPMLEGVEGTAREVTAILLENEKQFIDRMDESTKVANLGNFLKFAYPMVRAIFPQLVAMDIVSVQPMQGPVSLVFYLDFIYGTSKGDVTKGDKVYRSGYPLASGQTDDQFDGHDSNHNYSAELVNLENTGVAATDFTAPLSLDADLAYKPARVGSIELWAGATRKTAVKIATSNANGTLTSAGATIDGKLITVAAGTVTFDGGANAPNVTTTISAASALTTPVLVFVTYEYISEGSNQVMEIDLQLQSTSVTARPRKLKANWSVEAANDLRALHNLDVESELSAVLADEIRFEIDREVITDLDVLSTSHGRAVRQWDRTVKDQNHSWYEKKMEFYDELTAQSNDIFRMTRRASGNFVVCGIDVANVIETLPGFQPSNVVGNGVVKVGTIRGQWDVYKDPYFKTDEYIVGYKGNSFLDSGYVFAPYIPLFTTPTYVFADFMGTKGMMSRYGKKTINNRFYVKGQIIAT